MQAKMETSAQRYKRIKAERLAQAETIDFTSPSGMVWKLRKPDLAVFIASGMLPLSLAEIVAKAVEDNNGDSQKAMAELDTKNQMRTLEFMGKVVRYVAVEPRIVENATSETEISFEDVEMDDAAAIFAWAMPGGDTAAGLNTFRSEQE